jgi:hypothetical protein
MLFSPVKDALTVILGCPESMLKISYASTLSAYKVYGCTWTDVFNALAIASHWKIKLPFLY